MKHLFVINPIAGRGKSLTYIDKIKEIFKDRDEEYIIEITERKGHAVQLVKEYTSKEDYRVYAIGGDGTLNEVLNGMINSNSSLSVIPCGTGNDFARTLLENIHSEDILLDTINGDEKFIDVAKANERYYINISSVGFDSEVVYNARLFKNMKFLPNHLAYIFSLFYTPFVYKSIPMKVNIDDLILNQRTMLIAASNGKCYGGGIPITPNADIQDGLLDICVVDHAPLLKLIRFLPRALKGKHGSVKEVSFYKAHKISVESSSPFTFNADGELEKLHKVNLEIVPNKVKMIVPKESIRFKDIEDAKEVIIA
ncbi:diacylglycerol kinase family lipid kinase [Clostridium sp. MSJ-4]|uniref:Diacylglycerol kinase family lipid kinase n=1 Tax=Clostridium simiarum TaxID=2841506 RepID=A0ABS6EYK1_9CLOT|nr:diacylglycerol kinase family protein [Clostridium simiarum]MBU5590724.1 diacylglycerol kinase family lipid kinase [Clostridium simiarum]